jgi:hypothetical protein
MTTPWRPLCPTSLPVRAAIAVVLDVRSTMGSAWNIRDNAIGNTTVNDDRIQTPVMRSIQVHAGDDCVQRSWQRMDSAKCVYAPGRSSRQPSLITERRFAEAEIDGLGKTWSPNVQRATRGKLSMRAVAGTTGSGGESISLSAQGT